jgi:hypothetical protein
MDTFATALTRLKADKRTLQVLSDQSGLPVETIRDIKAGVTDNPRLDTMRKLVALYKRRPPRKKVVAEMPPEPPL